MLDELLAIQGTVEFKEDGYLHVVATQQDSWYRLVLRLAVETGVEGGPLERWELRCEAEKLPERPEGA